MTTLSAPTPPWRKALLARINTLEREIALLHSVKDSTLDMLVKGHEHEAETIANLLMEGSAHRCGNGRTEANPTPTGNEDDKPG